MADFLKFRSSVGGFNRSDVTDYIEASSLAHQKAIRKLTDENKRLSAENETLTQQLDENAQALDGTKQELASARSALDETKQKLADAEAALALLRESLANDAQAECDEATDDMPETSPDELPAGEAAREEQRVETQEAALSEKELEAYRRAEAVERNALQRAEKLNSRLNALCDNARSRYAESGDEFAALSEDLRAVIARLQETLADVQVVFDETENAFDDLELPTAD